MRKFLFHLALLAGMLVTLGACADGPTFSDQRPPELAPDTPSQDDQQVQCVVGGVCLLPPVSPAPCDPWEDLNWCEGDGGNCITSLPGSPEDQAITGCGGGTPGGGTPPPPPPPPGDGTPQCPDYGCPPPEQPDTCRTGEAVVDDPDVSGQFNDLWLKSLLSGTERGGWVVRDGATSFRLIPFQSAIYTACGIDVYEPAPAGTVSIVHTHPWPLFQPSPCGYINSGTPSAADINALQRTGLSTGYFLDANGIGKFTATGGATANRIGRCGY
jgi:hypothetical protein